MQALSFFANSPTHLVGEEAIFVDYCPKGQYLNDSNYFIGIMPNGEKRFYACEGDYRDDLKEYKEKSQKNQPSK